MNADFLTALDRIEREKGIKKDVLFDAIESALVSAAKKVIDDPNISKEDIEVTINRETGEIELFSDGYVVENERLGRIAAQTAKQVILQKIREAERAVVFDRYSKKKGEIISGSVHRFEKGNIIIELEDTEAVLTKTQQIPGEKFRQGELVRAYVLNVNKGMSGPNVVLSRSDVSFVRKLFEMEVPEISQGIVEIKAMCREAGERTKMSVYSKDEKIDPVGACVGIRGSRVRDIVKELNGERVDIIRWNDDIREYVPAVLNPVEISKMAIDRENKVITLTVPKDQLALLIGKKGSNIRLASKLLDWELVADSVEVKSVDDIDFLMQIEGIDDKIKKVLKDNGYDSLEKVLNIKLEDLLNLDEINEEIAHSIKNILDNFLLKKDLPANDAKIEE